MKQLDAQTLVGLACNIGTVAAIEFSEFAESLQELDDQQQRLLLRGYLATTHMPRDASLEADDLRKCLRALRQAWLAIAQENRRVSH